MKLALNVDYMRVMHEAMRLFVEMSIHKFFLFCCCSC